MSDPISDALLDSLRAYDSNNHLPECPFAAGFVHHGCICDRLRACEQRIREWYNQPSMYDEGYYNGVRDSFDAVERVRDQFPAPNGVIFASQALSAIKELRP